MIKRCVNDNVNWQEWTYKNIPAKRKLRAYHQSRKFAGISDIPTYRCDSYWLEKKLIEKFYRHKSKKTIKKNKTSIGCNGKGKEKEENENRARQEDDDEQQQQLQEDGEDDLSWDSDLEQLAGYSDEDVEGQLFGEGNEYEGSSSQPPAKRRRYDTFN
ncbi:hypothetical protein A0J61_11368 [Choanephora cucurbitarum]|uniref:Uncharacterized protein n=1 Tax=Choanephora cucurbitarum TaxID=101091 RepID=A0A1C7MUR4_9FUNG|nr:hypothetical protein A0J61_11368 [Choanephora cucurbitarum]